MVSPFILRFQELCLECEAEDGPSSQSAGTSTHTKVRAESSDADMSPFSTVIIPAKVSSGTQTKTAIPAETSDLDPHGRWLQAIPPVCCSS